MDHLRVIAIDFYLSQVITSIWIDVAMFLRINKYCIFSFNIKLKSWIADFIEVIGG
jgi:hypothetical protein